jgi:hypothetical protein
MADYRMILHVYDESHPLVLAVQNHFLDATSEADVSFDIVSTTHRSDLDWGMVERAREKAREMMAGLMPGNLGREVADEIADKILYAAFEVEEPS